MADVCLFFRCLLGGLLFLVWCPIHVIYEALCSIIDWCFDF